MGSRLTRISEWNRDKNCPLCQFNTCLPKPCPNIPVFFVWWWSTHFNFKNKQKYRLCPKRRLLSSFENGAGASVRSCDELYQGFYCFGNFVLWIFTKRACFAPTHIRQAPRSSALSYWTCLPVMDAVRHSQIYFVFSATVFRWWLRHSIRPALVPGIRHRAGVAGHRATAYRRIRVQAPWDSERCLGYAGWACDSDTRWDDRACILPRRQLVSNTVSTQLLLVIHTLKIFFADEPRGIDFIRRFSKYGRCVALHPAGRRHFTLVGATSFSYQQILRQLQQNRQQIVGTNTCSISHQKVSVCVLQAFLASWSEYYSRIVVRLRLGYSVRFSPLLVASEHIICDGIFLANACKEKVHEAEHYAGAATRPDGGEFSSGCFCIATCERVRCFGIVISQLFESKIWLRQHHANLLRVTYPPEVFVVKLHDTMENRIATLLSYYMLELY